MIVSQPSILHLLILVGASGAVFLLRREARGRSLRPGQLFQAPALALLAATVLLALVCPEHRQPQLWAAGLAAGLLVGAGRGVTMRLQVDQIWTRLRLPHGRDGLFVAGLLGVIAAASFGAELAVPAVAVTGVAAATAAAACTGFLGGRAGAVWMRHLGAPHSALQRV